jgi:hypothetical protein
LDDGEFVNDEYLGEDEEDHVINALQNLGNRE